jgi:hypothetical protein
MPPTLQERLAAGLEAMDWRETAAKGPWDRWGKFGYHGGAYYILWPGPDTASMLEPALWYSPLAETTPKHPVKGPILSNILAAGDKALGQRRIDTEALIIELLYK